MNQELFNYLNDELSVSPLTNQMSDIIEIANKPLKQSHEVEVKEAIQIINQCIEAIKIYNKEYWKASPTVLNAQIFVKHHKE